MVIPNAMVKATKPFDSGKEIKLLVELKNITVKIEPNYILRGTVFPVATRSLSKDCAEHFGVSISANVVSTEDLYAGKICAALDRQHPRDLFDIHFLLQNEPRHQNLWVNSGVGKSPSEWYSAT